MTKPMRIRKICRIPPYINVPERIAYMDFLFDTPDG